MQGIIELALAIAPLMGAVWLAVSIPADGPEEVRRVLRDHLS
ncbi:MAG TPA: hypothetical protein VMR52_07465 [Dehalococcoidia bacterium]|nr:hypothetical protein [Dehalococcoidia bacterium]